MQRWRISLITLAKLAASSTAFIATISILLPSCLPAPLSLPQNLVLTQDVRKAEADQLLQQGARQFQNGQFEAAIQSWQQTLKIYREIGDRKGEVYSLNNLVIAYNSLEKYEKVIELIQLQLPIAREIGDRDMEAASLNNLGYAYNSIKKYEQAIEILQQSLTIAKEIGNQKGQADALNNLGESYRRLQRYQQAIEFYQHSLAIAKNIGDARRQANALVNLAITYYSIAQYQQAIDFFQESLTIAQQIGNRVIETASLTGLGNVYGSFGEYQQAIDFYQQSLTIAREIGARSREAGSLNNMGEAYRYQEQYQRAINFYQQALAIARDIGDRAGEAIYLNNIGIAYKSLGQHQKAIEFYLQQLAIAQEIGDRFLEAAALNNLGLAAIDLAQYRRDLKEYERAIDLIEQSLVIKQEIGDRNGEGISLNNLGLAFLKKGDLIKAEKNLRSAIEVWESIRQPINSDTNKVSIFDTQVDAYRLLQQVLILKNNAPEALEISERGRARAFVELLARRLSVQSDPQHSNTYLSVEEIKQITQKQKATLVEYSINYSEWLFIWVVKPTGEVVFRQVDLKKLQQQNKSITNLVPRIRNAIGVRSGNNTNEAAFKPGDRIRFKDDTANSEPWEIISVDAQNGTLRVRLPSFAPGVTIPRPITEVEDFGQTSLQQLHQILIEPIADLLPKNPSDRIIFIPQGELFLVPFAALQDKEGKYLIEKHTILTAPSIQVLDLTRKQRQRVANSTAKDVLVVGNPSPMPKPFAPLEYAAPEAKAIANLLNTNPIIGTEATESAIVAQMPNARIIHLATHGLFDDIRGLGSAIALAPSGKDDGLLTAEEILNLKLNAELVVLSACDTGRGRLTGDGVIGLSRSLISAGVPSVIVSLWRVPDNTTAGLMVEFYRQLDNNPDKAQALRQAMLNTMKQHPNPRDWAAFTLIGEAE